MIRTIDREELRRRLGHEPGLQLVEVLPRQEFDWAHLPGARHLPLKRFDTERLDRRRPVVVYCNDFP